MQNGSPFTKRNIAYAIAVQCAYIAIVTLCAAYVNMLFLSNYPTGMLSYFYFSLSVLVALISLSLIPIITRVSIIWTTVTLLALIVILLICKLLLNQHYPWAAFVFSLALMQVSMLAAVIGPNAVASKFNLLEFKAISKWLGTASAISGTVIGLVLIYGLDVFGTQSIFYLLISTIVLLITAIYLLKPERKTAEKMPKGIRPSNYVLYRQLFTFSIFAAILFTLIDFLLKDKLGTTFNEIQIGRFMAIYLAITSILALGFQLGIATKVLERYGMRGLISALPIFCIVIMVLVFIFPSLITITIAASGWTIFYFNFNNIGREIALNALPIKVRNLGQFYIKAIALPLGIGTAAILLWLLNYYPSIRPHALVVLILSVIFLLMSRRLNRDYRNTLGDVIQNKHFAVDVTLNDKQTIKIFKQISLNLLTHDHAEEILFGITLLKQIKLDTIPRELYQLIDDENTEVRTAAIEYICEHGNKASFAPLIAQLPKETNDDIKWYIIQYLVKYADSAELKQQLSLFQQDTPVNIAARILICLRCADLDTIAHKLQQLNNMINNADPNMRKWAAKALAKIKVGYPLNYLKCLLEDSDQQVAQAAAEAISSLEVHSLLPALIHKVNDKKLSRSIAKLITTFGNKAIPQLSQAMQTTSSASTKIFIKILLTINPSSLVDILMPLTAKKNVTLATQFATKLSTWSLKYKPSANIKPFATMKIHQELELIHNYQQLLLQDLAEFPRLEVKARLHLAYHRLLHWIVVRSGVEDILHLIPKLLPTIKPLLNDYEHAKAVEYLVYSMLDKRLAKRVAQAFTKNVPRSPTTKIDVISNDPWLTKVFAHSYSSNREKHTMNTMKKMLILRKVDIFKTLPAEILLAIAEELTFKEISKGEIIFKENDQAEGFYIVNKGTVELQEQGVHLHDAQGYEIFGVLALLDNAPRVMAATAKTDCLLLFLSKSMFDYLVDESPELLRQITVLIMFYLRQMIKVSQWAKTTKVT